MTAAFANDIMYSLYFQIIITNQGFYIYFYTRFGYCHTIT